GVYPAGSTNNGRASSRKEKIGAADESAPAKPPGIAGAGIAACGTGVIVFGAGLPRVDPAPKADPAPNDVGRTPICASVPVSESVGAVDTCDKSVGGIPVDPGKTVKNSLAMRASIAGSGRPAGRFLVSLNNVAQLPAVPNVAGFGSFVFMVLTHLDVFEHGDG